MKFIRCLPVAVCAVSTSLIAISLPIQAQPATPVVVPPQPTRIVIEAEDMKGVDQKQFGFGPTWRVGRWGKDLYQNMVFGGVWASRLKTAMTDASDTPAAATSDITVPSDGDYKVWAKYECPPFFNYAFGIKIQRLDGNHAVVFDKTYGLLNAAKHFSFNNKLITGSLYWSWGLDHDAAEGYVTNLKAGRYRVTLYKTHNPAPAGGRSVDALLITSDLSELSAPQMPRYPLLDELRRANHVYFRFHNLSQQPVRIDWNHWNHRYPDFYSPAYRNLVKFYGADGKEVEAPGGDVKAKGDWPEALAPGATSVWYDLGPTMNVESTSPFKVRTLPFTGRFPATEPTLPFSVDIALSPNEKSIVKSFATQGDQPALGFLVQPDLNTPDGVAYTKTFSDIYSEVAKELNATPRLGPIPKKMKLFGTTGDPLNIQGVGWGFDAAQEFRYALGMNTIPPEATNRPYMDAMTKWWQPHGGLVEPSSSLQDTKSAAEIIKKITDANIKPYFNFVSYGDEIGLPPANVKDPAVLAAFREYVKAAGETPQSLGVAGWDQVIPLPSLSADVAVKIGVLPTAPTNANPAEGLKRLYWYSTEFSENEGIANFAQKTRDIEAGLGQNVQTTANLGSMHPFYWMQQSSFIDAFKGRAMTLAFSEDYTYCQPEASRLVVDFESSYLRKGASYHDTPMRFYCMPHWPGNSPERLMQNAVMLWGENVKDLDWFNIGPDIWATENYVAYRGGLPEWQAARAVSGMAGAVENDLMPARPVQTPIAMLLSKSSDLWEVEGGSQGQVAPAEDGKPATIASNVSQEERKDIWDALREAGYRVDFVTEDDLKDGLLSKYKVLYVCGQNLQRSSADALKTWVQNGGIVYATAGAARKDEFDQPLTTLDDVLGRGAQKSYDRYRGPLRAKLELLFLKPLDHVHMDGKQFDALASKETFTPTPGAQVLARYDDNSPAMVKATFGKGIGYTIGTLPGQAYIKAALPVVPAGKGGDAGSPNTFEPVDFDTVADAAILRPLADGGILPDVVIGHRSVVAGRLAGPTSTVLTLANLAQEHDGTLTNLPITVRGLAARPSRVWSPYFPKGMPFDYKEGVLTITLPKLASADVVVISK